MGLGRWLMVGYWGLVAGILVPLTMAESATPVPREILPLWGYGLVSGATAALSMSYFVRHTMRSGRSPLIWCRNWLLLGVISGLSAVAGGAAVFAAEFALIQVSQGEWSPQSPALFAFQILATVVGIPVIWLLAFLATSGIAVVEGLLAACVSLPIIWLAWRKFERRVDLGQET